MRKAGYAVFVFSLSLVGSFVYYYQQQGDYDFLSYFEWLQSLVRGIFVKIKGGAAQLGVPGAGNYMDIAASVVAGFETFSGKVYNDAGKMAIGYGHDIISGDGFNASSTITEADAYTLLLQDLDSADQCVNANVRVDLTDNQRAALLSLAYNIGCGAFSGSTLLSRLNAGDYDGAAAQFAVWNKSHVNGVLTTLQNLIDRRSQEAGLFQA